MAAGELVPVVAFWKEWGTLALVLLSFVLQVILLITAEIRRRKDSGVLKVVVWSAYLLADTTAIYVLGHMSVTSKTSQEHQLQAFWAPFLLLHLGGQDNITAYSIEDNQLWLRHLQSFVFQVFAAAYVLYQSSIMSGRTLLRPASILMFVVGVVKYAERICALKLAGTGSKVPGKSYQGFVTRVRTDGGLANDDREDRPSIMKQTVRAHVLLAIPKHLLKGPLQVIPIYLKACCPWEHMYGVAEMQLSLMHDVFYSKTELIHTWHGYCIRSFSLSATVAALLLFRQFGFSEKDGYRRADVAATYVLLAGAVVLEITSLMRVMFSTWPYGKTISKGSYRSCTLCVARALARLSFWSQELARSAMCRRGASARYWSDSMGQHNFIYMCSNCKDSRGSKIARWMGREDWWNLLVYRSSVPVSPNISQLLKEQINDGVRVDKENPDHILNSRGRAALKRIPGLYEELGWSLNKELDESILVWHIATHVYLNWYEMNNKRWWPDHLAQVTRELSNYMMFLLAARTYMLPDNASWHSYVQLFYNSVITYRQYSSEADLLGLIWDRGDAICARQTSLAGEMDDNMIGNNTFDRASLLVKMLIGKELESPHADMLTLISQVWVEMLCYAAHRCRPDSHARQLSNGGEFITVVALMLEYTGRGLVDFNNGKQPQHYMLFQWLTARGYAPVSSMEYS